METKESIQVPYSCEQMFSLVCDVPSYKYFLKHCTASHITERADTHNDVRGSNWFIASLVFDYKFIAVTFTTKNIMQPPNRLSLEYISGTFSGIQGAWNFEKAGENTQCVLSLSIAIPISIMAPGIKMIASHLASDFIESFVAEAHRRYQKPSLSGRGSSS